MISVYVHIPFCLSKCSYCDFYSIPIERSRVPHDRYCGALLKQFAREVKRYGLGDCGVTSIYFGGGTPSLMPPSFFEKVLWAIGTTLVMQGDAEITCEVNPATVDAEWFKRMVRAGINRFSIGVQSFQDAKLKALGRPHTAEHAQRTIAEAQDAGGSTVSVDMMYGLPKQSLPDLENDLRIAMTFQPDHISAYQLTVDRSSSLAKTLPTEDVLIKQIRLVRRMLSSGGWNPYEISNFAKPNRICRHNMHYWRYGEYIGLGSGATSFISTEGTEAVRNAYGLRWRMSRDVDRYLKGRYDVEERDEVSKRTAMGEFCFLGLRTSEGISLDEFSARFGKSIKRSFPGVIGDLEGRGLLRTEGDMLALTEKGIELSNLVFESFVE